MHYVYLLESLTFTDQRYVGITSDLKQRLADHNAGKSPHTSKYTPWKLVYGAGENPAAPRYVIPGSRFARPE
jgi:predicted GIY-YIG superfamily endonuclease